MDDPRLPRLLGDEALEGSSVVANCAMNRERQLAGVNSYTRELGVNPGRVPRRQVRPIPSADASSAKGLSAGAASYDL